MDKSIFTVKRKNYIALGEIFFWTATINKWQRLLWKDDYKNVIVSSLQYLSDAGKVDVFAFVIMPNHIHLIWRVNEMNGKETAQGSFLKYTAHEFKKMLKNDTDNILASYAVKAANKSHEFWQRDSLAIPVYTREVAEQKLTYIHQNPTQEHWQLSHYAEDYPFSSCSFYHKGYDPFSLLNHYNEVF